MNIETLILTGLLEVALIAIALAQKSQRKK